MLPADSSDSGEALRRLLFDGIRQLKPDGRTPYPSPEWRRYQYLLLRYVNGMPARDVARQLGVSERQARRDHHEAVEALASVLRARYQSSATDLLPTTHIDPPAEQGPQNDDLEAELAKLVTDRSGGLANVNAILEGALATARNLAKSRDVRVEAIPAPSLPPVALNRNALRHILLAVLTYIIESNPGSRLDVMTADAQTGVEVIVTARRGIQGGCGPAPPTSPEGPQAATLVAISRVLQRQGGNLQVRGREVGDLDVRITLPAADVSTVLVVDDNPDFVRLFQRYLAGHPYRLIQANVTEEALRLAREIRPDVITVDVLMPADDGWQILEMLRSQPETRGIPVVVCSVLNERALALSLGANDFLAKPVTPQALLEVLARCCGLSAS